MTNLLGLPVCYGYPERQEPPTVLEYTAAEWWVRESYRRYFQAEGAIPQIIDWQLERFFTSYDTGDPVLEVTMELLESDFRNVFTQSVLQKYARLARSGGGAAEMNALLAEAAQAGPRKPDMLGISATRTLLFDAVEVGTVKTAQSTYKELNEKMRNITDAVIPQLKLRLPALQERRARGLKSFMVPSEFVVQASAFRLKPWEMILPLPVQVDNKGAAKTLDLICYHPTTTWTPQNAKSTTGTDGLVIYHIHRVPLPKLPNKVREQVEFELNRWKREKGLVLELNPALSGALASSSSSWSPESRQLFAYLGVGALVLLFLGVAVEAGVIIAGATIAEAGLAALAGTPASVLASIRAAAFVASEIWPLAVAAAPLVPIPATQR
jgi:hypothetical protein